MPTLTTARLQTLLAPYLGAHEPPPPLIPALSAYLDLLLKWNARTNLTAIRDPEEIVQRHFGESLFTGIHLASRQPQTLLDFGSGAGFPGLPIQLLLPHLAVTLAESQNKKASFLREVVRTLALPTEIWSARVEALPPTRTFAAVTLRAVDHMPQALAAAHPRVAPGGWLAILTTEPEPEPRASPKTACAHPIPLPAPSAGYLVLTQIPSAS